MNATNLNNITDEILKEKLINKYLNKYHPVELWETRNKKIIVLYLITNKNYFKTFIEKYKLKHKEIYNIYFDKNDGSIPSTLTFNFKI